MYCSNSAFSTAACMDLMEREILRSRESQLSTTASSESPTAANSLAEATFSRESSDTWISPSTPSSSSTNTPKSVSEVTLPVTTVPGRYLSGARLQGSGSSCLMPSERRSFSTSTLSTTAMTSEPLAYTSPGCLTRFVQEMSETCTSPSMPSSMPINMPKSVMFLICPSIFVPTGYLSAIVAQ